MPCHCEGPAPTLYVSKRLKARKLHRCCECGGIIDPGEQYERVVGVWDGEFDAFKTCSRCLDLRDYTKNAVPCFCWMFQNMIEDAIETLREYSHELPGLLFGGYRRQVKIYQAKRPR